VQGNVLALDPGRVYLYSNTLQAIAVGYLLAAPLALYMKPAWQLAAIAVLLIIYSIPMHLLGDWSAQGNFACLVDKALLGRFRDGSVLAPDGSVQFAAWYDYTWLWSSLTFCCTVALGSYAGHLARSCNDNRPAVAKRLLFMGVALLALGLFAENVQPIIKRIWSASMVLCSAGWCYLLLALCYWWIDIKGHNKGWEWLLYYGCNAIVAYLIGELVNLRGIASSLLYGTEQYLGNWYGVLLTLCNSLLLFVCLRFMYRNKIFLKV
jgi:predicted acyltransferase